MKERSQSNVTCDYSCSQKNIMKRHIAQRFLGGQLGNFERAILEKQWKIENQNIYELNGLFDKLPLLVSYL